MSKQPLIESKRCAQQAAKHAYNRYSQFAVGAALRLKDGRMIPGCNVENASYGLTNCAERTAIYAAIAQGIPPEQFDAMTIYMPGDKLYSPCGACRQVIAEFFPPDAQVHATCDAEHTRSWRVKELLPGLFSLP